MLKSTTKNLTNKQNRLGQYFTPKTIVDKYMSVIDLSRFDLIIEPSFGSGVFLNYLKETYPNSKIVGVELDIENYKIKLENVETFNQNFYDFSYDMKNKKVAYIGNPPYRTPAYSLKTHQKIIKDLFVQYNIKGIKEEAVIFFLKVFDDLKKQNVQDFEIHFILPKVIFQSTSKSYQSFIQFLKNNLNLKKVYNLEQCFEGVSQDLVFVSYSNGVQEENIFLDDKIIKIEEFYGQDTEIIDYRDIFKKTSLGSVPAESIFLSIKNESKQNFQNRLTKLFLEDNNLNNIKNNLSFNNKYHLKVLNGKNEELKEEKFKIISKYIQEIKDKQLLSIKDLSNEDNYKIIQHRNEERIYFRCEKLKKVSFIYILNPIVGSNFYFTSNPSKTSTDYFGFAKYDVNRNSTPGSLRTVLLEGLKDNIKPSFLSYWNKETNNRPIEDLFDYILFIIKSDWYIDLKNKYYRFYFGVPKKFNKSWLTHE